MFIPAFFLSYCQIYSRGSAVTTVIALRSVHQRDCSLIVEEASPAGVHPASYSAGSQPVGEGVTRPKREADHLSLSNTKIKNNWSYTSFRPYAFMASTGTALRDHYQMCKYSPVQSFFVL
jgi:hypothetical protein